MTDNSDNPGLPDIAQIRKEIDRVDTTLLGLIAERLELAGAVRRAKSGARVWRPSREHSLIKHLAEEASGTSPHLVSRIWAELMSASLALQGPIHLHVALEGDAVEVWSLVRDRFGAAIPVSRYPTASSALAAAYADSEGVAILPTPGPMNTWWSALCHDGAMPDMQIQGGLPRVSNTDWPKAVAVANFETEPNLADRILLAMKDPKALHKHGVKGALKTEAGDQKLVCLEGPIDGFPAVLGAIRSSDPTAKLIGVLARPLTETK